MALQDLLPNADINAGWTETPAGAAWSTLDETDATLNTADFVSTGTADAVCEVAVQDFSLPAGAVVNGATLRVHAGSGAKRGIDLRLMSGATELVLSALGANTATGWYEAVYSGSLTQAQVNDLRCHFTCRSTAGGGGAGTVTVYAARVVLDYTVSVVEQRAGGATAPSSGGGPGSITIGKTGGGTGASAGGGPQTTTFNPPPVEKTGGATSESSGGASRAISFAATGGATTPGVVGGAGSAEKVATGGGVLSALSGGSRSTTAAVSGGAASSSIGGGLSQTNTGGTKAGGATTESAGGGIKSLVQARAGGATSEGFAGGVHGMVTSKTGGAISGSQAGGTQISFQRIIIEKTGGAQNGRSYV